LRHCPPPTARRSHSADPPHGRSGRLLSNLRPRNGSPQRLNDPRLPSDLRVPSRRRRHLPLRCECGRNGEASRSRSTAASPPRSWSSTSPLGSSRRCDAWRSSDPDSRRDADLRSRETRLLRKARASTRARPLIEPRTPRSFSCSTLGRRSVVGGTASPRSALGSLTDPHDVHLVGVSRVAGQAPVRQARWALRPQRHGVRAADPGPPVRTLGVGSAGC